MDPITIAAIAAGGVGVAQGVANWMVSDKAAKARGDELRRMEDIVNKLKLPDFDKTMLQPEELKVLEKFSPEIAPFVAESAPETVKAASTGAVTGRSAQMDALAKYRGLADTGDDLQSKLLRNQALRASQMQNQGQQGRIQQSFAQRGQGGSTNELVSSLLAQQGSNLSGQRAAEDAAMQAYNTRLAAMRGMADLGGQIRQEDVNQEGKNADILNAYNTRMASARRGFEQDRAAEMNKANLYNINMAQNVANSNVNTRNKAAQDYQDMMNQIRQKEFNNQDSLARTRMGINARNIDEINRKTADTKEGINAVGSGITKGIGAYSYGANNAASLQGTTPTAAPTPEEERKQMSLEKKWWE